MYSVKALPRLSSASSCCCSSSMPFSESNWKSMSANGDSGAIELMKNPHGCALIRFSAGARCCSRNSARRRRWLSGVLRRRSQLSSRYFTFCAAGCRAAEARGAAAALAIRVRRFIPPAILSQVSGRQPAEPPLPFQEIFDAGAQLLLSKVGPCHRREEQLRISALPEEEVAEPLLAARADEQVNVGRAAERLPEGLAVSRLRGLEPPHGFEDRVAGRIVDRHPQPQALAAGRRALSLLDKADQRRVKPIPAADHFEPHALFDELPGLAAKIAGEQAEQRPHLTLRPLPVVRRECVQGQRSDSQPRRRLHGSPDRFSPRPMPRQPGQPAGLRPTAVPIHDDGDMQTLRHLPPASP